LYISSSLVLFLFEMRRGFHANTRKRNSSVHMRCT
jgi:hypothetical protein